MSNRTAARERNFLLGLNAACAPETGISRSLMSRLSLKQDGMAVVHECRAGFLVDNGSRERGTPETEPLGMGPVGSRPPREEAATDLRRSRGWRHAPVFILADAPEGETVRAGQENAL